MQFPSSLAAAMIASAPRLVPARPARSAARSPWRFDRVSGLAVGGYRPSLLSPLRACPKRKFVINPACNWQRARSLAIPYSAPPPFSAFHNSSEQCLRRTPAVIEFAGISFARWPAVVPGNGGEGFYLSKLVLLLALVTVPRVHASCDDSSMDCGHALSSFEVGHSHSRL